MSSLSDTIWTYSKSILGYLSSYSVYNKGVKDIDKNVYNIVTSIIGIYIKNTYIISTYTIDT